MASVSDQHGLSLLRIGAADGGKVGVWIFLFGDRNRWSKAKGLESLLDEDVSDAVERRVNEPQRTAAVQIPERREQIQFSACGVGVFKHQQEAVEDVWVVVPEGGRVTAEEPNLCLPVEAERGQFFHVAAVDLGQRVGPQGGALHQPLVPARGAPGLQLLLDVQQDLLVVRRADLSAVTPVYLHRTQTGLKQSP